MEKNLKPGDRLPSGGELVVMFGVRRSTVREAVKLLTADNIVEIHRGRDTFIMESPGLKSNPLGPHFVNPNRLIQSLLGSRLLVESQIARLAAQRTISENLYRLDQAIGETGAAERINGLEYPSRDVDFHTAVVECTQNDVLRHILFLICESIREGYFETMNVPGTHQRAIAAHIRTSEATRDKNPDVVAGEARRHILQAMDDSQLEY